MGATAVAPDAVLDRYDQLTRDRARLVDQIDQAEAKVGTLESERQTLLPQIADGDKSASSRADSLDREKVQMQRQVDGLRMKLGDTDRSIADLAGPRNEIFEKRAAESRRQRVESYRERIRNQSHNMIAHWRAACRARFHASEVIFEAGSDPSLTERDRIELLSEASLLESSQGGAVWNEHWENARGSLGPWRPAIVAAKPPDVVKHLEDLK
jgi:chromosome segregation ATPase